ncbi:hypothetical protein HY312_04580 [Candidatus Saccharibacteria bacterium]|nr:hypothetical protein [Candidatus Saccharibacteria bacterium]
MTPPPFTVEAPTLENPFGGYEGKTIVIPIVQDGNVWTVLDSYNAESVIPLSYDANEELIHNLVNELGRQLDRDPNLVYPGEVLEIDLTDMPAPSITTVPPAETFEKPQGVGSPYSDGSDPSMHSNEGPSPVPCDPFWTATCSSNGE